MSLKKTTACIIAAALTAAAVFFTATRFLRNDETWTFAFYLNGDGNLLLEQQRNLREIVNGNLALDSDTIVVCLDRGEHPKASFPYSWAGPGILHVKGACRDSITKPVILQLPKTPDGSSAAQSMAGFFSYARDNCASDHYAFFIAGHGRGWFPETGIPKARNTGCDANDISQALTGNTPDILCLDLCFMGDIESAYQLKDRAKYLILSQGPIPAGGQDYKSLMKTIRKERPGDPLSLARMIFRSSADSLKKSRLRGSVSLVQTGAAFDSFITHFFRLLRDKNAAESIHELERELVRHPEWGAPFSEMIDLKSLTDAIDAAHADKTPEYSSFVLDHYSSMPDASGLSVFYPLKPETFIAFRQAYLKLDFNRDRHNPWLDILEARAR